MRRLLLTVVLLLLPLDPSASIVQNDPLIGTYRVEGSQDGEKYTGVAAIDTFEGSVYAITWQIDGSDGALYGLVLQKGDALSVIFSLSGHTCFGVYNRAGDRWVGQWTCQGLAGQLHPETLIRTSVKV